jgi:alpha-beta hydrolase superfamily lysophospholipase
MTVSFLIESIVCRAEIKRLFFPASWFDHSRDLLHLINLKRDEMPRPLVGIGHSMGGAQL